MSLTKRPQMRELKDLQLNDFLEKHGEIILKNGKFFYKKLPTKLAKQEISGWEKLSAYYPTTKFIDILVYDEYSVLLYEYNQGAAKDDLLLYQFIKNHNQESLNKITLMYSTAFKATCSNHKQESSNVFFKDRIEPRLKRWYQNDKTLHSDISTDLTLNNYNFEEDLSYKTIVETVTLACEKAEILSIVSQCDPNDLNVTSEPLLLDYTAGGYVPLMAEFATFIWYHLAQAQFLAPVLHKKAFEVHPDIYTKIDYVEVGNEKDSIAVQHTLNPLRLEFIEKYSKEVIEPLFDYHNYLDWYSDFLGFITMKILCVFNLSGSFQTDSRSADARQLSIAYLRFFYSINSTTPTKLITLVNNLHIHHD